MLSRHFLAVLFWHRGAFLYRHIVADLSWLAMTRDNWNFDALFVRLCVAFRMLHLHALLLWHGMALLNGKLAWSCVTVSLWHRHAELLGRGMAHSVGYGVALLPVLRMAILVIHGFTVFAGFSSGHIDAFFAWHTAARLLRHNLATVSWLRFAFQAISASSAHLFVDVAADLSLLGFTVGLVEFQAFLAN